ncbi:hypothetical protein EPN90_02185 [Patescibacteria group bacterium]|nr:MAG: hypothetical protein EPN90_02185 [Patescibacteria group bacterium]
MQQRQFAERTNEARHRVEPDLLVITVRNRFRLLTKTRGALVRLPQGGREVRYHLEDLELGGGFYAFTLVPTDEGDLPGHLALHANWLAGPMELVVEFLLSNGKRRCLRLGAFKYKSESHPRRSSG